MNNGADSQFFLLEIAISCPSALNMPLSHGQRQGKYSLKIPASRLGQQLGQLGRLGNKLVSITPVGILSKNVPLPWWVEIYTDYPRCLYYFGPFDSQKEAEADQGGFIEDLYQEGAEGLAVQTKQCQPQVLTQEW
ncbi:MAG: DUF1816 domain-containing protein [Microcystaceae cyanobacterium]